MIGLTACSPSAVQTVEIPTEKTVIVITPTQESFPTAAFTPSPTEVVEEVEMLPTPTPTPTIVPTTEPLRVNLEGLYKVSIQSEFKLDWFLQFFRELEIRWCEASCSTNELEALLEFGKEKWVAVQSGRVFYVHSGWSLAKGPEFGEILLRIFKSGNLSTSTICLDEELCYDVVDYTVLTRNQIDGAKPLDELFAVQQGDYFIVTCSERSIPGISTPKLIIQIRQ